MMTDEAQYYGEVGREMVRHDTVNHKQEECVRGDAHKQIGVLRECSATTGLMSVMGH